MTSATLGAVREDWFMQANYYKRLCCILKLADSYKYARVVELVDTLVLEANASA